MLNVCFVRPVGTKFIQTLGLACLSVLLIVTPLGSRIFRCALDQYEGVHSVNFQAYNAVFTRSRASRSSTPGAITEGLLVCQPTLLQYLEEVEALSRVRGQRPVPENPASHLHRRHPP